MPVAARNARRAGRGEGPDLVGTVIDQRFRVLSHIGSGGMADVYEAEHVTLGRKLALKVLRHTQASNVGLSRRFSREARVMSHISSEHVVSVFDYGVLPEGFPFFVMDLLRGHTLRAVLEAEHELNVTRVCNLAIDVCLGLHAAHQAGLVHRDLKPENLWLTRRDDGREACILLDFGVARFEGAHTTNEGALVGTACYMSPEQIGTDSHPGPQSDIFALAVIAYECLAGVAPFAADSLERTLFRVLNEEPRPLPQVAESVSEELWAVLRRALHKEPAARFETALAMASALLPFAGPFRQLPGATAGGHSVELADTLLEPKASSVTTDAEQVLPQAGPAASRRRALWGTALLAFAVGAGLSAWVLRQAPALDAELGAQRSAPPASALNPAPAFAHTAAPAAPVSALTRVPGPAHTHAPASAHTPASASLTSEAAAPQASAALGRAAARERAPSAGSAVAAVPRQRKSPLATDSKPRTLSADIPTSAPEPPASSSSSASTPSTRARIDPPQPRFDGTNPYHP